MKRKTESLFSRSWQVAKDGYEWREGRLFANDERGYRKYEIESKEYLAFANVSQNAESILEYANHRGDLHGFDGESTVEDWKRQINDMRTLVRLQQLIRDGKKDEIKAEKIVKMVERETGDGTAYRAVQYLLPALHKGKHAELTIADSLIHSRPVGPYWNDYLLSAKEALFREVNERLNLFKTVPHLTWTSDHKPIIEFRPDSLLSCLWLQFAQTITGRYAVVPCAGPGCTRTIEIGNREQGRIKVKGTQAVTCGHRCRQKYCRERIRKAQALMREHPKVSDSQMLRMLQAKGIAGGAWRGEAWVRRVRASLN
jgi:hypothetical protein